MVSSLSEAFEPIDGYATEYVVDVGTQTDIFLADSITTSFSLARYVSSGNDKQICSILLRWSERF